MYFKFNIVNSKCVNKKIGIKRFLYYYIYE